MEEDEDKGWAGIGTGLMVAGTPQPPEDNGVVMVDTGPQLQIMGAGESKAAFR